MAREYFCAYHSYLKQCKGLSDGELGRLFRSLLQYSATGAAPELNGRESVAFDFMAANIDRDNIAYMEKCQKMKTNGQKGAKGSKRGQMPPEAPQGKEEEKEEMKEKALSNESAKKKGAAAPTPQEVLRHKHGEYGWVRLSADEYNRLVREYGESVVAHYIAVVDERAQMTGNKNKWKDWNLTVRNAIKGKWGGEYNGAGKGNRTYSDPSRYEGTKEGWK